MREVLSSFIGELRTTGVPVSLSGHVDAARAVEVIDLLDRAALRESLAATLVKDHKYRRAFDHAFDLYFSPATTALEDSELDVPQGESAPDTESVTPATRERSHAELREQIRQALLEHDIGALRELARDAVSQFGAIESGRPVSAGYYLERTMRQLDESALREQLFQAMPAPSDYLGTALREHEADAHLRYLRELVEHEILQRLIEERGVDAMAAATRETLPEDVEVMNASPLELAELEKALRPLSRALAARLSRRRRHRRRGPLDLRATITRSRSTGGVPLDVRFRPPRPHKPEIFVLADVSGSVSSFARFTLLLVHAISAQFSQVRSFVFVDSAQEVTDYFRRFDDPVEAVTHFLHEGGQTDFDGHSDYGRALSSFAERYGGDVTSRTTLLILGDARTNYHVARADVLRELQVRSRAIYWLNPERRSYWNSGDSVIDEYERFCTEVQECRTLRQLEAFVSSLG